MKRLSIVGHPLVLALLAGALLRALLWGGIPRLGLVGDEGEYLSAASWLADDRGFSWYSAYLWTRAPLYPIMLAAHLRLFGQSLAPIFLTQTLLSLLNVALVYDLAARDAASRRPLLPALLMALYLPFAIYTQTLLSETLFLTLLLASFAALLRAPQRLRWAVAAGALLGLATLTRSLTLPFIPLAALWLYRAARPQIVTDGHRYRAARPQIATDGHRYRTDSPRHPVTPSLPHHLGIAIAFVLAAALTIAPWTLYNSRVFGGAVVVDTSGAFNALLGARTAYDGRRQDAPVRSFVLALLGQADAAAVGPTCAPFPGALPSQAARQSAMTAEALCLIRERPLAFAQKSLAELIDLFQINYTGAERFTAGFTTGRLPVPFVLATFLLDDTLYVLALPLGVIGWALARRRGSALASLAGLWWGYNLAVAPLLFAINRFRLPLLPLVFIFAAQLLVLVFQAGRPHIFVHLRTSPGSRANRPQIRADRRRYARTPASGQIRSRERPPNSGGRLWLPLCAVLACLLWLAAATPHAYLEPRAAGADSRWASYLGPYPSSLAITGIAIAARPQSDADAAFAAAVARDDFAGAAAIAPHAGPALRRIGPALLAAYRGDARAALALASAPSDDALASVVRGDALRTLGDLPGARAAFTPRTVDDANPVTWAYTWLRPAPNTSIDFGGNLDLGSIDGCYLGEGDQSVAPPATFRWCTDGARLRFVAAGSGAPQTLRLRIDGRGWVGSAAAPAPVTVLADGVAVGMIQPGFDVAEYAIALPPRQVRADIVVTLRMATFVPPAERYLRQQSEATLGQVQRLGARLDWAALGP